MALHVGARLAGQRQQLALSPTMILEKLKVESFLRLNSSAFGNLDSTGNVFPRILWEPDFHRI